MDGIKKRLADLRQPDGIMLLLSLALLLLFPLAELSFHSLKVSRTYLPLLRCAWLLAACAVSYLGAVLHQRRTGSGELLRVLLRVYFVLYLLLILSYTLIDRDLRLTADRLAEEGMTRRQYYMKWFVNFRPFYSIYTVYIQGLLRGYIGMKYTLINLLGNLCAFMPFAYFLPCFWKKMKKWYLFLPTMLLTVAAVEGLQLWLMVGSCDIDDLILNAGGAFLLFWILRIPPIGRLCDRFTAGFPKRAVG